VAGPSRRGQLDAASVPTEELDAGLLLEPAQGLGQGRLGELDVEKLRPASLTM
jgi:hypothetical protein